MVHIVAISDLHGRLPEVPMCDLLLIAGDVCPDCKGTAIPAFRPLVAERQLVWLREVFSPWLTRQPCGHVVMCWGNHDYVGELPGARLPTIDADDELGSWTVSIMIDRSSASALGCGT